MQIDLDYNFSSIDKQLDIWNNFLNGEIEDGTLKLKGGEIRTFRYEYLEVICADVEWPKDIVVVRRINKDDQFIPIQFTIGQSTKKDMSEVDQMINQVKEGIYFTNIDSYMSWGLDSKTQIIVLRLKKSKIKEILGKEHPFCEKLDKNQSFYFYETISAKMRSIIYELLNNNHSEKIRNYLCKSYSWILLSLLLERFINREDKVYQEIKEVNLKQIFKAREILLNDFSKTITIKELSRECGLSSTRLRDLFKTVYGKSIHKYFQEYRMEEAKRLLLTGKYTVSDVGYKVGYSHLGHFSAAFKKMYNVLPKSFLSK
ncbi:AraC family transcriptional regulator [Marinilabiliaceae bacterium JC040]|nr:AraC family transcriptional regulator [Marinilabiliaceae bacterium JC040]